MRCRFLMLHRAMLLAQLFAWTLLATPAQALEVVLVLTHNSGAHARFAQVLSGTLGNSGHRLLMGGTLHEGMDEAMLSRADLILVTGAAATAEVLQRSARPTLALLIGQGQYHELHKLHPDAPFSAIVLDQPPARQLALLRAVLPDARTFSVLLGPDSTDRQRGFETGARQTNLNLLALVLTSAGELLPALEHALRSSEVMIAQPDTLLTSPTAARSILLTSYRYRRPILAFSQAFVDAGALAAVFSSPDDVARDVAEWLHTQHGTTVELPPARAASHFSVALNAQVARALDIPLEDAPTVLERIRREVQP